MDEDQGIMQSMTTEANVHSVPVPSPGGSLPFFTKETSTFSTEAINEKSCESAKPVFFVQCLFDSQQKCAVIQVSGRLNAKGTAGPHTCLPFVRLWNMLTLLAGSLA